MEIVKELERNLIVKNDLGNIEIMPNNPRIRLSIELDKSKSIQWKNYRLEMIKENNTKLYKFNEYILDELDNDLACAFIDRNENGILRAISTIKQEDMLRDIVSILLKTNRVKFKRHIGFIIDDRYVVRFNNKCQIIVRDHNSIRYIHFCVVLQYESNLDKLQEHIFKFGNSKTMITKEMVVIISKIKYILDRNEHKNDKVLWNQIFSVYPDERTYKIKVK